LAEVLLKKSNKSDDVSYCHLTYLSASALPCKTGNPKIVSLHLNIVGCFANKHTKHIQTITWS